MAEFVSLVSGAATLVTLGSKCVQGLDTLIKAVRYGTDELAALSNEVSDLEFLFTRIRLAREDIRSGMPLESSKYNIDDALLEHFALAKSKYLELQELINEVIVTSSNGTEKVDTIAWFRKRSSAKRIQQQLKARKRKIYELLDTSMASTTARVEVSLQGYHNMVAIGLGQLIDQGAMIQGILPQVLKSENALEHTTRRTLQEPPKPGESDENISSESCALIPGAQREDLTISTAPPSMRRKPSCGVECDCACHRGRRMRTPRILQNIIGNLFVGYVGLPYLSPKCNSFSCQKRSAPILTARYQFPFWFIAKVLFASFAPDIAGDPRFGLTVRNRVQPVIGKDIFEMARLGDTEGVKEMLDKGLAGANDVHNLDGCSAIHLAIAFQRVDICKLLLSAKADPFMENDTGFCALRMLVKVTTAPAEYSPKSQELIAFLPVWEMIDEMELSHLHKIVIGLRPIELAPALQNSACLSQIDHPDSSGLTALHWAVVIEDVDAVRHLLQSGANPIAQDCSGRTPMHDVGDAQGRTIIELLANAGANIESRDFSGLTPLHLCALGDGFHGASALIEMGADINNVSARGVSILHDSVFQGSHSVLELLLQNGVNYRHVDEDGGTVLHCLARYGDIQTTRILTAARLKGLDTDAEDVWGWTARDWLEDRHRFLEDIGEDFELLLESIRDADEEDGEQESEDEEIHPEKEEEEGGEEKEGDENQDHEHDDDDNDTFVDAFEDLTI